MLVLLVMEDVAAVVVQICHRNQIYKAIFDQPIANEHSGDEARRKLWINHAADKSVNNNKT